MIRRPQYHGPLERQTRGVLREAGQLLPRPGRLSARPLAAAAEAMIASLEAGHTVYFCGNGGSAADAQHLACELAGRVLAERPALPAVALSTNTSSLTAIANDYGFDQVFSRQLEGLGRSGDVLVAITTSGTSANVLRTVRVAHRLGMTVIGMTGLKGKVFADQCDFALVTPSLSAPHIQEGHIMMGHALCELVERALFPIAGKGRGASAGGRASRQPSPGPGARNARRPGRRRVRGRITPRQGRR